ncbi:response regulator [Actinomycetospora termitidis]|uniref:Response regulator transcription factor n=1 Tax=Actinomycetospora termitidis TaxID=3053470 RepID=A0ABT7MH50_9PSEU|nr:response regulator transcription factor [Actinomycetospora sp. Odt1-22]MDL5160014.1 response regulator transcription factor [Actinomycetospora sp. Odt1-22]
MTVRVLVVDDQAVVRAGFRAILDAAEGIEVVGEAGGGPEAVTVAAHLRPDVVLMDVRMPAGDGVTATRAILDDPAATGTKVLVVSTFDLDEHVFDALRAGAGGFVLKDIEPERLVEAIRLVHAGEALLAPSITRRLIGEFVRLGPTASDHDGGSAPARDTAPGLSARERDVVAQVARGLSNAEIAAALVVAESTVKTHVSSVLTKWDLRDRVQLVVRAHELGLVGGDP